MALGGGVNAGAAKVWRWPRFGGSRLRMLLAAYFLVGLVLVGFGAVLFAGHTARQMERQAALLTQVFSRFVSETAFQVDQPGAFALVRSLLHQVDFPIIITMADGTPLVYHGVGVPPPEGDTPGELAGTDLAPELLARRATLDALVQQFDRRNAPYPITAGGVVQGYVHFGQSSLFRQLSWMPVLLVVVVAVFVLLGFFGVRALKMGEQRSIWVGMAKETAHQLGTPLTSLLGWVQLLQGDDEQRADESVADATARRQATYAEMERDLGRLSKVSARFSKIGAAPELVPLDLGAVLQEQVQYIRRRTPLLGAAVRIESTLEPLPHVLGNRELIEWVFENLLKNALDALENGGEIHVRASSPAPDRVETRVADSGRGIPAAVRQRIWEPGFTTKKRGWGLGLTLVRRIVEEFHGGRIWVEDNPGRRGTCFVVRLRAAPETAVRIG